jgi:hypothetical protein
MKHLALSRNHCCSGKEVRITNSECAFVALSNQYAMRMCHIVICGLSASTILLNIISNKVRLSGGGERVTEHKMSVLISSANFGWNIYHSEKK